MKLQRLRALLQPSSIRTQAAAILVVAVLAVAVFSLAIELRLRGDRREDAEAALRQAALLAADGQQERLRAAEYVLVTMASYNAVVEAAAEPELSSAQQACHGVLRESAGRISTLVAVSLFDVNGSLICSSADSTRHASSIADRLYFRNALATGAFGIGNVVPAQSTGRPSLGFAYPVRDAAGSVTGVLATGILLDDPRAFLGTVTLPGSWALSIVDGDGTRISTTDARLQSQPAALNDERPGIGRTAFYEAGGRRMAVSRVTPANASELYAIVSVSNSDFPALVDRQFVAEIVIIVVALAAAVVTALWLMDARLVRRLRLVKDTATRIEQRDFEARSGLGSGQDELAALARELDSMAEALQQLEREREAALEQRDEFLGFVSHELKNLSFSIWSDARLLGRHGEQLSHGDRLEIASSLGANSEKLQQIISDIFMLARAQLGDVPNEPISPAPLVRQVVARFEANTPRRTVDVSVAPDVPPCEGQATFFEQVLLNLLTNAHKYSPAMQPISVEVEPAGGFVQFRVRDRGKGVTTEELERIFERYYRSAPAGIPGTGLGLAVCRRLIETQGGTIWAENLENGFAVTFTLPALRDQAEERAQQPEAVGA